ncbi:MAG TPA: hypothetical protein VK978_03215 [Candidatus Saccharimonadales bacterium]|nr:hypothetical protein [Candidatus Saccharimonadales bacterium]
MVSKRYLRLGTATLGALLCLLVFSPETQAAPPRKSGVTIAPAFQEIVITPDDPSKRFDFAITNNTAEPLEFSLSVVDFGSLDESGGVLYIGDAKKQLEYRYGLTGWVTLAKDRVVVEPKSTEKVPVTIFNRESLTPGGHYGAILVSPAETGERPTKVQINQVLSSLLFVKKQGGEVYRLGLQSHDMPANIFKVPESVGLRFQNAGNVHVVPRGTVTITDPAGRVVRRGFINQGSTLALPESFRQLPAHLETVRAAWLPGRYGMEIAYRFDGKESVEITRVSFVYINIWLAALTLAILVLSILMLVNARIRRAVIRAGAWPFLLLRRAAYRR